MVRQDLLFTKVANGNHRCNVICTCTSTSDNNRSRCWTITQLEPTGTDLKFAYSGTDRFKLASNGELTVEEEVAWKCLTERKFEYVGRNNRRRNGPYGRK